MNVLAIIIILYFIVSTICMLIALKDEHEEVETSLIIFMMLVFPIALLRELFRRRDK